MASIVSAGTTSATALNMSADTTGILQLASNNGTVALSIGTDQNIGINSVGSTTRTKLMVSSSNASDTVTVGTVSGGFSITNTNSTYGLQFGSLSTGNSWIQSARMDGTATAYNLILQPGGGNVGIGTSSPASASGVALVVHDASTPRIRLTSTTTGQAATDGAELSLSGSDFYIENREAQNIVFYSGSERGRFDPLGNFLVGKSATNLGVVGVESKPNGYAVFTMASSTNSLDTLNVYSSTAVNYRFYVGLAGTVFATNTAITAISDQRLKENIRDLDDGLDVVLALKPRKFDWKEGKGADIKNARGFIAQEFEQVLPDMIDTWKDPAPEGEEPYKAVNANLIPTLVKAIQELSAKVTALENK